MRKLQILLSDWTTAVGVPLSPDCRWHNLDIADEEGSSSAAAQLVAQLLGFSPPFYPAWSLPSLEMCCGLNEFNLSPVFATQTPI